MEFLRFLIRLSYENIIAALNSETEADGNIIHSEAVKMMDGNLKNPELNFLKMYVHFPC